MVTLSPPLAPRAGGPKTDNTSHRSIPFPERDESCPVELYEARYHQLWQLKQRKLFKADNGLTRDAKYPVSKRKHFAWLIALLLFESALNAYFFSKGSYLGLMGGWMQAILLSAANVGGAAALAYFGFRQFNHVAPTRRAIGQLSVFVYFAFAVSLNLFAAHYRDWLELTGGITRGAPGIGSWWTFTGLSFDSILLFALGMFSSALGVHSGYHGDDAYPGYSDVDRKYVEAKEKFLELRKLTPRAVTPYPHVGDQ